MKRTNPRREDVLRRICVFCGSSIGVREEYRASAEGVGRYLAAQGIGVVYGGGKVGLMGVVADAALAAGGEVIGVIPDALLRKEIGHGSLTRLHVVDSMHERKAKMAQLADAFLALPGGLGTFEEFCEVITWSQLGLHRKPCGLLNVSGYYTPLLQMFDHAVSEGFLRPENRKLVIAGGNIESIVETFRNFRPLPAGKWIGRKEM